MTDICFGSNCRTARGVQMCEFCENIAKDDAEFFNCRKSGGDFIFKDEKGYSVLVDTGDSFCCGSLDINFCPMCGRDLRGEENE